MVQKRESVCERDCIHGWMGKCVHGRLCVRVDKCGLTTNLPKERCKRGTDIYHTLDTWMFDASTATPAMTTEPHLLTNNDLSDLQAQISFNTQGRSLEEIMDYWLQVQDDSLRIYKQLGEEYEKQQKYQVIINTKRK